MVRSCSAMSLAELRADILRFTREAERLMREASMSRKLAEEAKPKLDSLGKRPHESEHVKHGDYKVFSNHADFLVSEAVLFEALVRDLQAIEKVMVERCRAEHPPGEMRG